MSAPKPTLSISHSFSPQLIEAAFLFSRLVAEFELKNLGVCESIEISEYKSYVSGAIFSAFSFIEATINELFWAARESNQSIKSLGEGVINALKSLNEEDLRGMKILSKYQVALSLAGKNIFSRSEAPFQDVDHLRHLRNSLIHYEPEWEGDKPLKLEKMLRSKFDLSPFSGKGSLFFPHKCLSHGCSRWAALSCLKFADDFNARMGLTPKYVSIRSRLKAE